MPYLLQFVLLIILLAFLIQKHYLSLPILIPVVIFMTVAAGCIYVSYNPNYIFKGGGIANLSITSVESLAVFSLFRNATLALIFGYLLSTIVEKILWKRLNSNKNFSPFENFTKLEGTQRSLQKLTFGLTVFFLVYNFDGILSRETYLLFTAGSIFGALRYLIPFIGLFNLYCLIVARANKSLAFVTYLACLIMEFSFASRSFGFLLASPFLFLAISSRNKVLKSLSLLAASVLATIGISISLFLRSSTGHGLLSYLTATDFALNPRNSVELIFGTFFVIIPVTLIGLRIPTPNGYAITSFNPMPGRLTDWYLLAPQLNVNRWTPSGAVAQLYNSGTVSSLICWTLVGFMIGACTKYLQVRNFSEINSIVLSALSFSASLQFLQYSLRSGMRFIYAMALFSLFAKLPRISKKTLN